MEEQQLPEALAELLGDVRRDIADDLVRAFNRRATHTGARMGDVMWAAALLYSHVLACAMVEGVASDIHDKLLEMTKVALPMTLAAMERKRRLTDGHPEYDA